MKKFVLILSCLLVLYSSFLDVYAEDDTQYYGTFYGEEYPIIYSNPDIMPLYDVSGFNVSCQYRNDSGTYVGFNQAVTLPNTNQRLFYVNIDLPNAIERGQSVDVNLSLNFNNASVDYARMTVFDSLWHSYQPSATCSVAVNTSTSYQATFNDIVSNSFSVKVIRIYFNVKPNTTNFSFYATGLSVTKVSDSALMGQLTAQMEMLIYLVQNNIVGSLTSILNAWNTYLENFSSWIHVCCTHIRDTLQDMSDRLDSSILAVKSAVTTIGSNIVNSITSMNNNLSSKIETMQNAIVTKLDDTLVVKDKTDINSNNTANDDLKGNITEYDDLESSAVEDFNTSLDDLNTENKLLGDSDFMNSARWVSTQLQYIYDSNIYISYMIDFSLILGIALTIIGIKAKGG